VCFCQRQILCFFSLSSARIVAAAQTPLRDKQRVAGGTPGEDLPPCHGFIQRLRSPSVGKRDIFSLAPPGCKIHLPCANER